ncbi:MAG: glycoside hydrolase family 65 protein [Clostridia bacterium]|nr:glycoside hydrolase family 65 protein [Clostridia bacterium]
MKDIDNNILLVEESLYATANGYIGIRGNFEEGYKAGFETIKGSFVNGFYDTHQIRYPESAYGFPVVGETMVQVADTQKIQIELDSEVFSMDSENYQIISREFDVHKGITTRQIKWTSINGNTFLITFTRMTHFVHLELFVIHLTIESDTYSGPVRIKSYIDHNFQTRKDTDDPRVATEHIEPLKIQNIEFNGEMGLIESQTVNNHLKMQVAVAHDISGIWESKDQMLVFNATMNMEKNRPVDVTKFVVFSDERRNLDYCKFGRNQLKLHLSKGYGALHDEQKNYMKSFFEKCEIIIEGDDSLTKAIAYSQYQLLAASGKDGVSQVAAKGLTGSGYEGHYFWDTEIYVIPFLTLTQPELAKQILKYRHNILEHAKERSLTLGHKRGAKMPWRTIAGLECSAYFPAGTAQYHINADVAYAYLQYYFMTHDTEMMQEFGYEVLYETALLWLEVGHIHGDEFCIDGVTGPDEYTAIVNNNYYTNAMAKYHLYWTVKLYAQYKTENMSDNAIAEMKWAAEHMRLPYDEELNIHKQDEQFLSKAKWDFENTPKNKYPLLLNFHPLYIYRHQVLKQADTVLAHFLLDEGHESVIRDSYHYYENITTHDSSLSPCVYGMMASRIKESEKAFHYFMKSVYLDLHNLHGNTKDGLHIANAGGTYMGIVFGFGGLRIKPDGIYLNPHRPKEWKSYSFKFVKDDTVVKVSVGDLIKIQTSHEIVLRINHKVYEISDEIEVPLNEH